MARARAPRAFKICMQFSQRVSLVFAAPTRSGMKLCHRAGHSCFSTCGRARVGGAPQGLLWVTCSRQAGAAPPAQEPGRDGEWASSAPRRGWCSAYSRTHALGERPPRQPTSGANRKYLSGDGPGAAANSPLAHYFLDSEHRSPRLLAHLDNHLRDVIFDSLPLLRRKRTPAELDNALQHLRPGGGRAEARCGQSYPRVLGPPHIKKSERRPACNTGQCQLPVAPAAQRILCWRWTTPLGCRRRGSTCLDALAVVASQPLPRFAGGKGGCFRG